ncbi:helix-turn-helix transcriptional regulator [Nonomuraea sp. NPDC048882]|uniref:helix-turn-helix domain-containing protein n=1 Tax=Nonomuraea sp. NPDC048882 TaxID=3154347 RepID=UPI0033E88061
MIVVESLEDWLTQPDGVATRLRNLRTQAGLSGKNLADSHGWQQSKVSRIENGKQLPSPEDVRTWAETCGASETEVDELLQLREKGRIAQLTFRSRMRGGQAAVQESYNALVREASLIRHFETVYVPGLLQVPAYTKRVLAEMIWLHELDVDDVDTAVSTRMQRQQLLYDPAKQFEFLLAEPVLRTLICPPSVMRTQLDRLQTVIGLERVRFGIIPMSVELQVTPQNSFGIYEGEESLAVVETFIGETFHRGAEAAGYRRVMDKLWDQAVTGDQARDLIITAADALSGK